MSPQYWIKVYNILSNFLIKQFIYIRNALNIISSLSEKCAKFYEDQAKL